MWHMSLLALKEANINCGDCAQQVRSACEHSASSTFPVQHQPNDTQFTTENKGNYLYSHGLGVFCFHQN